MALVLALGCVLFALGWARLRRSGPSRPGFSPAAFFARGVIVTAALLSPPVDHWADQLFSVHMVQHLALMLAAAALLAASRAWVPAGFVCLAAICRLFVAWLRDAERRALLGARAASAAPAAALVATVLLLPGCNAQSAPAVPGFGNPAAGAKLIVETGCGSCHTIPGITGANGLVGPPLTQIGRRVYLAGLLRNTPDNMVTWLKNPQAIVPGNAMPAMGLTDGQARDIAAYLSTLQ